MPAISSVNIVEEDCSRIRQTVMMFLDLSESASSSEESVMKTIVVGCVSIIRPGYR